MREVRRTFHVGHSGATRPIVLRNTAPRVWRTSNEDLFMYLGHTWLGEKGERYRVEKWSAPHTDRTFTSLQSALNAWERSKHEKPPSLTAAALAAGHEPETKKSKQTIIQAITPMHLQGAEVARKARTLQPGDEIKYTNFTVGGSFEGTAIVTWDHGKSVEARTLPAGEKIRLERAADGLLRRFT